MRTQLLGRTAIVPLLLAATVGATNLLAASSAKALTFDFSFTDSFGTVTGEIDDLSDNTLNQAATAVFIDSGPAFLAPRFAQLFTVMSSPHHGQ